MKKKVFFSGFIAMAITAMATWNVNFGSKTNGMSDMMLANVEALAQNEWPPILDDCGWNGCRFNPDFDCYKLYNGIPVGVCPYMWSF